VSILKELKATRPQITILEEWLEAQPKKEREEWLEAMARADLYPSSAIVKLLEKHGLPGMKENAVVRYRRRLPNYVSSR
jgi:hypothetical protein